MADIKESALELIGGTPLLKLNGYGKAAGVTGATLLAKLEYLNPAGSVKDRVALSMIEDAEKSGKLKPGEQLPTVRALALEIGINSMTVSKAYQLLKQEGYILTDRKKGAVVREMIKQDGKINSANKNELKRIISESKLAGVSEKDFIEEVKLLYKEG